MPLNQLQSGSPNLRRVLFALLLIASIVMCVVYVREGDGGPLHSVQDSVRNATGLANGAGASVGVATGSIADVAADATANPDTLTGLREQNEQLRNLLAQAEEYRQEANRLQGLLNMKQTSGVTGPVGHIVGRSTNAWDQSVTIDLGTEEGVSGGMAVMGASGVIGQISKANAHTSTVRLLTDPNSGAAVMIQSSRANGIVRGSINGLLYLEDLEEDVIPAVGDVVVTSGLGGSYDRGLMVGTVVSVNKTASDTTGDIIVEPNGDASILEEVIVVYSAPDVAAAEKAKEEAAKAKAAQEAAAQEQSEGTDGTVDTAVEETGTYDETAAYDDGSAAEGYTEEYVEEYVEEPVAEGEGE